MDPQGLEQIAHRHGVELILEFGSMVTGHVHLRSDVDLAVLLDRPTPSFETLADPRHELQALYLDHEVEQKVVQLAGDWIVPSIAAGTSCCP